MKSIILTHGDIDGIASAAIILRYLKEDMKIPREDVKVIFTGPSTLLEELKKISEIKGLLIYITDISLNLTNAEEVKSEIKRIKNNENKIFWMDHHQWREEDIRDLEKTVDMIIVDKTSSAARIVYEKLMKNDEISKKISMYADDIDTLTDKFSESFILRTLTLRKEWKEKLLEKFLRGVFWDDEISLEAKNIEEKAREELDKAYKKVKTFYTKSGLKFGFIDLRNVKTPKSWISRKISEKLELDFMIVWRRDNAMSVYIGGRGKDINLLKIAERYNGGGHPFACGFRIKLSLKSKILNYVTLRKIIPKEVKEVIEEVIKTM